MRTYVVIVNHESFICFSTTVIMFPAFLVDFNMLLRKTTGNIRFVIKHHVTLAKFLNMSIQNLSNKDFSMTSVKSHPF